MAEVNPDAIARQYLDASGSALKSLGADIRILGFIASDDPPSIAYANATQRTFEETGFHYELRRVERLALENEVLSANADPDVHGIFIYFPIFNNQEDDYLRNLVHYTKDVEAGSSYWTRKMSANERVIAAGTAEPGHESDPAAQKKALLPCTPLAIIKILDEIGEYDISGRKVTIFNRSEVIGRPLAVMMSNDGAEVTSFDEYGCMGFSQGLPIEISTTREEALAAAEVVITGVPSASFTRITASELGEDAICLNFSSIPNFEDDISSKVRIYVPRVGPMTVAMCMRNTLRLYENFHQ